MTNHPDAFPGVVPIGGPEPTLEWVRPSGGILGVLSTRLGSDPRAEELLVAVLRSLRTRLPRDTWDGIAEELPYTTRALLRADASAGAPGPQGVDLVDEVARARQHPPRQAALEVRAAFATLRNALPRGLSEAVASELGPALGELWRTAR